MESKKNVFSLKVSSYQIGKDLTITQQLSIKQWLCFLSL